MGEQRAVWIVGVLGILGIASLGAAAPAADSCAAPCDWGYGPTSGPPAWAARCCPVCSGPAQSPIDIAPAAVEPGDARTVEVRYGESHLELINTGHTIELASRLDPAANRLLLGDAELELAQVHFHSLSEHTFGGRHSPLEMHLVHRRTSYDLAVIAVMIEEGEENAVLAPAWTSLPVDATVPARTVVLDLRRLLPADLAHYSYHGSLTTPPCSEVVSWLVLRQPLTMSIAQIEAFRAVFAHNYRPVQPLNGRIVRTSP